MAPVMDMDHLFISQPSQFGSHDSKPLAVAIIEIHNCENMNYTNH